MSLCTILLTLLTSGSSLVSASSIDEKLYNALNVKEINKTPDGVLGSYEKEKKSGSLVCTKISVVMPNAVPSYKCTLVNGEDNELYDSLRVPEVDITPKGLLGSRHTEKKIGDEFSCKRVSVVVPRPAPKTMCGFIYKSDPEQIASPNSKPEATK